MRAPSRPLFNFGQGSAGVPSALLRASPRSLQSPLSLLSCALASQRGQQRRATGQGRAASFVLRPWRLSTPAIADLSLGSAVSLPSLLFMGLPSGERSRLPQTQNQRGRGAAFRALLGGSFVWSHAAKQLVDGQSQTHVAKPAVRRHSLQGVVEFFFAQARCAHAPEACRRSGAPSAAQQ